MITEQELDTNRLHRIARHLAFTRTIHECPEEVTKDLEQAAWLKYLTLKTHDYLWKDLEYAMLEEISRLVYQCKRGRGKTRILLYKMNLNFLLNELEYSNPSNELHNQALKYLTEPSIY